MGILLVESDDDLRSKLFDFLSGLGSTVWVADSAFKAKQLISEHTLDISIVITQVALRDGTGFETMDELRLHSSPARVVVTLDEDDPATIMAALNRGAVDFLVKPFQLNALYAAVTHAQRTNIRPRVPSILPPPPPALSSAYPHPNAHCIFPPAPSSEDLFDSSEAISEVRLKKIHSPESMGQEQWRNKYAPSFIGSDPALLRIFGVLERVADTDCSILVTGESGTGKELVAQAVHQASQRRNRPFVTVNCAAIPENLIESELFGHSRGAFTGAVSNRVGRFVAADTGTLFLDEIGELPVLLQAKLLRALQDREVTPVGETKPQKFDVRIITATNRDLDHMVEEGRFREDLLYRLNVIPVELPPLRQRRSDIEELIRHFIRAANHRRERQVSGITSAALRVLINYEWPGNVRQLENTIERIVILRGHGELTVDDIPAKIRNPAQGPTSPVANAINPVLPDEGLDLRDAVERYELALIRQALERTGWNKNRAASMLHMNRTTLVEKLKKSSLKDDRLMSA